MYLPPQANQKLVVPLDFLLGAVDARRPDNKAHVIGNLDLLHQRFDFLTVFLAFNFTGYAAAELIGKQNHISSRQGNVRRKQRSLIADDLPDDLNDDFLAGLENRPAAGRTVFLFSEIFMADVPQRQKAVLPAAVIDKSRLQTPFNLQHFAFVNISGDRFPHRHLDIEFNQFPFFVHRRHAHLFFVHGVHEHNVFHNLSFSVASNTMRTRPDNMSGR